MFRVRFAPSPTGELHIGGARTALYNYLFAKKNKGKFIIRIEDTDQERFVPGSLDRILQSLKWLGLQWDEGPDIGGEFGPYVQSERLELYQKYAQELVQKGGAYYCFCSASRLEILRELQQSQNQPTKYDLECLKLTPDNVKERLAKGEKFVIRLKVPEGETIFTDRVRGKVCVKNSNLDDQVLLKSDSFPTYHLANVVDDHLMQITHIIRGEEWLPSTPKHLLLYKFFGWQPPEFAHLPSVLNDKRAKLSKRKDGEAVWVQTYERDGYLPEALTNFLALLGWHPKDNREIFSLEELVKEFDLDKVQKGGAIFSMQKLRWFNAEYIKKFTPVKLDNLLKPFYKILAQTTGQKIGTTRALTKILQSRLITLRDINEFTHWYFTSDFKLTADILIPKNGNLAKTKLALQLAQELLINYGDKKWEVDDLRNIFEVLVRPGTFTRSELLWPVRVALTGERQSPDVFEVAFVLGREECLKRLLNAQKVLV